jgi:hypothetical protein
MLAAQCISPRFGNKVSSAMRPSPRAGPPCGRRPLELPARLFQQPSVRHARGAHRLARAAAEAEIEVVDEVVARLDPPLREPAHQVEAAARRVRLDLQLTVRRARGEAEAAVNAGVEIARARCVVGVVPAAGVRLRW